jgi:hypothetical protein
MCAAIPSIGEITAPAPPKGRGRAVPVDQEATCRSETYAAGLLTVEVERPYCQTTIASRRRRPQGSRPGRAVLLKIARMDYAVPYVHSAARLLDSSVPPSSTPTRAVMGLRGPRPQTMGLVSGVPGVTLLEGYLDNPHVLEAAVLCRSDPVRDVLLRAAILKARVLDNGCATTTGCKAAAGSWQLNLRRRVRWNQDQPMEAGSGS